MAVAVASRTETAGSRADTGAHHSKPAYLSDSPPRLEFLDGLRGLAALYVVMFHFTRCTRYHGLPRFCSFLLAPFSYGHYAVSVFIVLSGFCLMLPVSRSAGQLKGGLKGFCQRRARRILPPYYAALLLSIVWAFCYHKFRPGDAGGMHSEFSLGSLLSHLTLCFNVNPKWEFGFNSALWSVATEWQIYFVFALALLPLWRRFGNGAVLVAGLALGLGPHYLLPGALRLDTACPWFVSLFVIGMIASEALFSAKGRARDGMARVPWSAVTALLFGGFCLLTALVSPPDDPWAPGWVRHYTWMTDFLVGLTTMSLIFACSLSSPRKAARHRPLALRLLESRPALKLGSFSYSLYLIHMIPAYMLVVATYRFSLLCHSVTASFFFFWAVGLPFVLATAYAFHRIFERPAKAEPLRSPNSVSATARRAKAVGGIL